MKRPVLIGFGSAALIIGLALTVGVQTRHVVDDSPIATARAVTHGVMDVRLKTFRVHNGRYPTTEEGLFALMRAPNGLEVTWRGPYVGEYSELIDPWGHLYQYRCPGTHGSFGYDLWSLGPDGVNGTVDDIGNWVELRN